MIFAGLTEEEVAAFKALRPPSKSSAQKLDGKAKSTASQGSNLATTTENLEKQRRSCSFHSELEFSDSDSQ